LDSSLSNKIHKRISIGELQLILSPSTINAIRRCPFSWDCSYRGEKGISVEFKAQDIGSLVHSIIADYYRSFAQKPKDNEVLALVKRIASRHITPDFKPSKKTIEDLLNNFIKFEIKRLHTYQDPVPTLIETYLDHKKMIGGKIDVYFKSDKITIDWKTGNSFDINLDMTLQGGVYKLVLNSNNYDCSKLFFVLLKSGRVLELPRVTEGFIMEEARRANEIIISGIFKPHAGVQCKYCAYILACPLMGYGGVKLWDLNAISVVNQ